MRHSYGKFWSCVSRGLSKPWLTFSSDNRSYCGETRCTRHCLVYHTLQPSKSRDKLQKPQLKVKSSSTHNNFGCFKARTVGHGYKMTHFFLKVNLRTLSEDSSFSEPLTTRSRVAPVSRQFRNSRDIKQFLLCKGQLQKAESITLGD